MTTNIATQTEAVLNHHLESIVAKDVSAIMQDYTEDSVLFTPDGPVAGIGALTTFFENFVPVLTPEILKSFTLARRDVDGELAYILWSAGTAIPLGTDTFVVKDGKIKFQTFAAYMG